MDEIQKILIKAGRKDLAQKYYLKVAQHRSLGEIASEISRDWKNVNFAAKPYLSAMRSLDKITDDYGMDSGMSVVSYFLANASSWRGETAKRIKKELNDMVKSAR